MSDEQITQLLQEISAGDAAAAEQLLPLVYDELRALARQRMAHEPVQTLQATALVHEAYLRLIKNPDLRWDHRGHFFAAAAEAMRRILIERARRQRRMKHGGELKRVDLTDPGAFDDPDNLLDLDAALNRLEALDARMARVVKLRFFAGLSLAEVAQALALNRRTVSRDWQAARAWLFKEMESCLN